MSNLHVSYEEQHQFQIFFFFFKKIFVGHMSICGATDTPVSVEAYIIYIP